jgi:hypothetical protein
VQTLLGRIVIRSVHPADGIVYLWSEALLGTDEGRELREVARRIRHLADAVAFGKFIILEADRANDPDLLRRLARTLLRHL